VQVGDQYNSSGINVMVAIMIVNGVMHMYI